MKKKQNLKIIYIITAIALIVITNTYLILENFDLIKKINTIKETQDNTQEIIKILNITNDPLSTEGFTEFNRNQIFLVNQTIIIKNNCSQLYIQTNEYQAYAIENGLKGIIDIRPVLHDINKILFDNLNITLKDVRINRYLEPHYFSRAIFVQDNKIINLDLKASDAIALAVRTNSPIYLKNSIIETNGKKTC